MTKKDWITVATVAVFLLMTALAILAGVQLDASWAQDCRDAGGVPHDPICYTRDAVIPIGR